MALAQRRREIDVAFGAAVANCEDKRWPEAMADLEHRLREKLNYHQKIKMTVAEIIVDDTFD